MGDPAASSHDDDLPLVHSPPESDFLQHLLLSDNDITDFADPWNEVNEPWFSEILNGMNTLKFEIHGRIGLISHGILQSYGPESRDIQMFDFCKESYESVKNFLKNYLQERRLSGYILLPDTLSFFYEAVCVGFDWVDDHRPSAAAVDPFGSFLPTIADGRGNSGEEQTCQAVASNYAAGDGNDNHLPEADNYLLALQPLQQDTGDLPSNPPVTVNQAEGSHCGEIAIPPVLGKQTQQSKNSGAANRPAIVNQAELGISSGAANPPATRNEATGSTGAEYPLVTQNQAEGSNGGENVPVAEANNAERRSRSYAEQRTRAKHLSWEEIANCFHLRLQDAATLLELCETTVKNKVHERLKRWPYRTVKRINRELTLWQKKLNSASEEERLTAAAEIEKLQQELADVYNGNIVQ
ncbi:hypothetical protein Nepgr_012603 [Nepenthes gracilis]|uniref:RWP-RK domain-containing protein n=1 Tax=Nepenthes gracilis TaxID=150966 RepID=A0AAD3SGE0_NEPGR|nr:hypothetical protein Nepgr_012603 [Nepenthes gracilis]